MTIRVKNWSKFQHFKDRRPPWIKLYRDILDDIEWFNLDPKAAKALVMIWLIASENDGNIPDVKILAFRIRVSEPECKLLIAQLSNWLVQDDISAISARHRGDTPETETETEVEGETEKRGAKPPALTLPDWLPESTWADWHAFRNQRKGWTHKARELSLATLTKLRTKGHDPTAVIEQSIERGWTGLFEPRSETAAARPQTTNHGKTAQAIQALEDMRHGNRLGIGRDFDGHAEAAPALAGKHASG